MNVIETLLIFVVAPLGLAAVLAALVYGRSAVHQSRYRPGRAWTYAPVWYVPHPTATGPVPRELPARTIAPALPAGRGPSFVDEDHPAEPGTFGGATGEW